MSEISYSKKNENIECVRYKDWSKSYPPHTHTGHLTVGYVEDGTICLVMNGVMTPGSTIKVTWTGALKK